MTTSLRTKKCISDIQVFISYRREGGSDLARLIWDKLRDRGYITFMDVEDLRSGPFNTALYDKIEQSSDMVLILTPNSLDRCRHEGDWLRLEVRHALQHKKNIVPVMARGFQWPSPGSLPPDLANLPNLQGVAHSNDLFEASIDKLQQLLITKPHLPIRKKRVLVGTIIAVVFICIVLFAFLSRLGIHTPIPSPKPATQAKEYFDRKDYAGAFHAYSLASNADLQNTTLHRQIEECARRGHLEKQFLERYLILVAQHPQQAILHNYLGNAYLMLDPQDKDGKARQQYETALGLDHKISSPLANLGIIAYRAGKPDEAESLFVRYLSVEPGDAQGWTNLGLIYIDRVQKKTEDAIASREGEKALRKAIQLEPGSAPAYKALGRLWTATGRKKEALNAFQRSLALNYEQPDVRQQVELLAWESGSARFPGINADDFKTRGLEKEDINKPAVIIAMRLLDQGKFKEAEVVCRQWIELEPNPLAWRILGLACERQGQTEDARQALYQITTLLEANQP